MKFRDLLNEKYVNADIIDGKYVEWFIDPTKKELIDLSKETKDNYIRIGIVDNSKIDIYAWNGNVTHDKMERRINFDLNVGFEYGDDEMDMLDNGQWKKFKNKEKLKKKINKIFPKIEYLNIYDTNSNKKPEIFKL